MSPELERILQALWECENSNPSERARDQKRVNSLIEDALKEQTGTSPRDFKAAIMVR